MSHPPQEPLDPDLPSGSAVRQQRAEEATALVHLNEGLGRRLLRVLLFAIVAAGVIGAVGVGVMGWYGDRGSRASSAEVEQQPVTALETVRDGGGSSRAKSAPNNDSQEHGRPDSAEGGAVDSGKPVNDGTAVAAHSSGTPVGSGGDEAEPGNQQNPKQGDASDPEDSGSKKSMCLVSVTSQPREVQVLLGDKALGVTPFQTRLACGKAVLTFRRERYLTLEHQVDLGEERRNEIEVRMQRPPVLLKISSTPPGARVLLDGKLVGTTPMEHSIPAYVRSSLELKKSGYRRFTKRFTPQPPRSSFDVRLRRRR